MNLRCIPILLLVACSSDSHGPIVELAEITVLEDGKPMVKIHTDGTTEMGYRSAAPTVTFKPGPTIKPDGTFAMNGRDVAQLTDDGTIVELHSGRALYGITVTADKITFVDTPKGAVVLALGADGLLRQTGGNEVTGAVQILGANTAAKRRAVLALVAIHLSADDPGAE